MVELPQGRTRVALFVVPQGRGGEGARPTGLSQPQLGGHDIIDLVRANDIDLGRAVVHSRNSSSSLTARLLDPSNSSKPRIRASRSKSITTWPGRSTSSTTVAPARSSRIWHLDPRDSICLTQAPRVLEGARTQPLSARPARSIFLRDLPDRSRSHFRTRSGIALRGPDLGLRLWPGRSNSSAAA